MSLTKYLDVDCSNDGNLLVVKWKTFHHIVKSINFSFHAEYKMKFWRQTLGWRVYYNGGTGGSNSEQK